MAKLSKVTIDGGSIDSWLIEMDTKLRKFKEEWAVEFLERVRYRTPVRTGALRDGWHQQQKQTSIDVSNTQPYAAYIEYGTPKIAPRAMLRTTLEEADQIAEIATHKAGLNKK